MGSTLRKTRKIMLASTLLVGASALATPALAAVFNVNDTADLPDTNTADNVCRSENRTCTLRAAVMQANATPGPDTIRLQGGATHVLTREGVDSTAARGDLDLRDRLTIDVAPGGMMATVRGNGMPNDGIFQALNGSRVSITRVLIDQQGPGTTGVGFRVNAGANVTLTRVHVMNARANADGAGILNQGDLLLADCIVGQNRAVDSSGGGVYNDNGATLALRNTTLRSNAADDFGGGVFSRGQLISQRSTWIANTAGSDGGSLYHDRREATLLDNLVSGSRATNGAGVFSRTGRITVTRSTLNGNIAQNNGGGLFVESSEVAVVNSTLSGNRAQNNGGGIFNDDGARLRLLSVTVTANAADSDSNGSGHGGGVFSLADGMATATHVILAGNTQKLAAPVRNDCRGSLRSQGFNILGTNDACAITTGAGDQVGTPAMPINPRVAPLAFNGGPTSTHALLPGSPAIDRGNPTGCRDEAGALLSTDQRGPGFPRVKDGNGDGRAICDIGSFER